MTTIPALPTVKRATCKRANRQTACMGRIAVFIRSLLFPPSYCLSRHFLRLFPSVFSKQHVQHKPAFRLQRRIANNVTLFPSTHTAYHSNIASFDMGCGSSKPAYQDNQGYTQQQPMANAPPVQTGGQSGYSAPQAYEQPNQGRKKAVKGASNLGFLSTLFG